MKLATVIGPDGWPRIGALIEDDSRIALLQPGLVAMEGEPSTHFSSMLAFLNAGPEALYKAYVVQDFVARKAPKDAVLPVESATFLSPVPVPESVRDAMAFEAHILNATRAAAPRPVARADEALQRWFGKRFTLAHTLNRAWYKQPLYYKGNRFAVVGHGAQVIMPPYTGQLDYELEWGVFIGKGGRDIPESRAREHIAGYTIFNDFSARDIQLQEMRGRLGPAKGKDFDTGNAIGPWLVTADEMDRPYRLAMSARVNGEEWSRGNTVDMYWRFEEIIAYISRSETLYPGEFIGSGTCSGTQGRGSGLELGRRLKPGDVVELEVERIGVLRNEIAEPAAQKPRRDTARAGRQSAS